MVKVEAGLCHVGSMRQAQAQAQGVYILFSGLILWRSTQVYVAESCASKAAITHLVCASGAKLLKRHPTESGTPSPEPCRTVVLHDDKDPKSCIKPGRECGGGSGGGDVAHVSHRWLTDSAGAFTIQALSPYRVH